MTDPSIKCDCVVFCEKCAPDQPTLPAPAEDVIARLRAALGRTPFSTVTVDKADLREVLLRLSRPIGETEASKRERARKIVADHYEYRVVESVSLRCAEVEFVLKGMDAALSPSLPDIEQRAAEHDYDRSQET